MKVTSLKMMVLMGLFFWIPVAFGQQGTVMPQAPVRQNMQMQGELKPTFGQGGNPGFFRVDRNGTVREGGPDEAGSDECWGTNQVQGLNGPLICCPDSVMRELRRKQKLQCLQPGQDPRELSQEEVGGLQFKNGQPVADSTEDCKPIVCDQHCDQQNQPDGFVKPGQRERDGWAMDGDEKSVEEKEIEKRVESRDEGIEHYQEKEKKEKEERDQAKSERQKLEGEYGRMGKSGQQTPAGKDKKEAIDKAKEKEKEANKQYHHTQDWIYHLKEQNENDQKRLDELRKQRAGMPKPDDNDPMARERFCAMNPNQCPELKRYQQPGTGQGKGVDTWVVNPTPDDSGGLTEDPDGEESQFLCMMQGQGGELGNQQGIGGGRGGAGNGGMAGAAEDQSQNCPGGGSPERGGGFGGHEGQDQRGMEVVRRDNCNNGSRGPRLPGDDVINPGDPTFFQCPEMGCVNQQRSSITMNNCPDHSIIGRRSRMSCHPYNGPAGAIDPAQ